MTKSRLNIIRYWIKEGRYFEAVSRHLDFIQCEIKKSGHEKRAAKLLNALQDDMRHLNKNKEIFRLSLKRKNNVGGKPTSSTQN